MSKLNLQLENNSPKTDNNPLIQAINAKNLALAIADAASDRKAEDIVLLKLDQISYLTDYFVIITGFSKAQLRAISDSIEEKMEKEFNLYPVRIEGKNDGYWILHDYGNVIAHIFLPEARKFYDLEAFWGAAEKVYFSPN